ncbi:MAG TPA: phospholipid carrier-dependent glycosyltransferase, partial [Streptosporangiaceae bacterium]|nr:phospholipid carrier-dependent glycosyltransferase [Streptosporangiaceae bacterium]
MRADETALPGPAHPADPAEAPDPGQPGGQADMTGQADARPASSARPGGRTRSRLAPPIPGSAFWGWAGPLLVTLFGGFLRFSRLGVPHAVVFDETYYVGDAWAILQHGVEINHVKAANALLAHGGTAILKGPAGQGELVAHPPLGKVIMAGGQWLFGLTPFGWRFMVALAGTVSILILARVVRR